MLIKDKNDIADILSNAYLAARIEAISLRRSLYHTTETAEGQLYEIEHWPHMEFKENSFLVKLSPQVAEKLGIDLKALIADYNG